MQNASMLGSKTQEVCPSHRGAERSAEVGAAAQEPQDRNTCPVLAVEKHKLTGVKRVSYSVPGAGQMDKAEQHTAKMRAPRDRKRRCLALLTTAKVSAGTPHTQFPPGYSDASWFVCQSFSAQLTKR